MPQTGFFDVVPKSMFFDRDRVMNALARGQHSALSKIGAFVMTRARSITGKRSKASSVPGQPPKRHVGTLHDLIYFAWDDAAALLRSHSLA